MHRIASATLAVFIAAIFAVAPIATERADAQARRATTSTTPTVPRDGLHAPTPGVAWATTSISCANRNGTVTTYTLSVRGGACVTAGSQGNNGTAGEGSCVGGQNGDEALATCNRGGSTTLGQGSCTQTTR
jgi:hypothetical protein